MTRAVCASALSYRTAIQWSVDNVSGLFGFRLFSLVKRCPAETHATMSVYSTSSLLAFLFAFVVSLTSRCIICVAVFYVSVKYIFM